jgi:DNA invertase Pin-like site-specific DNA recombinase
MSEPQARPERGPQSPASTAPGRLTGYRWTAGGAGADHERLLEGAGCALIQADDTRGREDGQPRLRECVAALRPGDVLVVTGLDQLGRTQREVTGVVGEIRERGAGLRSLRENLDTTAPGGEAVFRVFAGLAGLGRAAISAGTSAGLAAARAQGKRLGRPPVLTPEQLREVRELLLRPESTVSGVARRLGVSRSTLYKYLPDALHTDKPATDKSGRAAPAPAHLAPYQARPGRRVLVIDDLADLRGPTTGSIELPLRLFWSVPGHRFDLADHDMRLWYYQTVLREASRPEDLTAYLDGAVLARLWPELYLPKGVKRAWEEHHQSLRTAVSA